MSHGRENVSRFTVEIWKSDRMPYWQAAACDGGRDDTDENIPFDYVGEGSDPGEALAALAMKIAQGAILE